MNQLLINEICTDEESIATKEKVMRKQRMHGLFYGISDTFKFIAGVLTTVGMAIAIPAFVGKVGLGFTAGMAAIPVTGAAILGAAVLATAIAVGTSVAATKYYTSGNYDALEVNARHTAKYITKELEQDNLCLSRADGKSWVQAIQSGEAARSRV